MMRAFEAYIIKALRDALPRIRSARVRDDAEILIAQDAQHARYHVSHVRLLTRKHPELAEVQTAINDSYRGLYERESLEFHLAYTANIELCFGPMAKFIIETRDTLFAGGDARISSFILWHFVEEFEHRNCAIDIFNDVVGSHLYGLRQVPATRRHLQEAGEVALRAFDRLAAAGLEPAVTTPRASRCLGEPRAERQL